MTTTGSHPFERVRLTWQSLADLDAIHLRSIDALREVFRQLRRLDRGEIRPVPLRNFTKSGDLSDCGKIIVEVPGQPEYRIVVRELGDSYEIAEVVVVETRADDFAYLLAGLRLGRIDDPIRRSDTQRRIERLRKLREPPS